MMSRNIDRLIAELVEDSMTDIKKMKKVELQSLAKELLADNLRELTNDTIVRIYEERYKTNLSGV
jgi:hypothetical protein